MEEKKELVDIIFKKILEEYKKGNYKNIDRYQNLLIELYELIGKNI